MTRAVDEVRTARRALLSLCEGASRHSGVDTPDSWMMRAEGARLRAEAIEALRSDQEIGSNIGPDRFLHVAGVLAGSGLEVLDPWLRGLLDRALSAPEADSPGWEAQVDRFLDVLSVRDGRVSCTVRSSLAGVRLADGGFELDDAIVRPARDRDFHVPIGASPPEGVVLEYRTRLPAAAGPIGFSFPDGLIAETGTAHQTRLTRFLLAVALATEAPIQEQLVMKEIDFGGGGSGALPEEIGPIASSDGFVLDEASVERIRDRYVALGDGDLSRLGVATRRLLVARTERVRPADQIIDYAIALESMTSERYAEQQSKELARLLARDDTERKALESDHQAFRTAREEIVHAGVVPADAPALAQLGRELVRSSLRARSEPRV